MQFATRINSFIKKYKSVEKVIRIISNIDGISTVELNLPEHLENKNPAEMGRIIADAGLNFSGAALRFRNQYREGEFGSGINTNRALDLARKTLDSLAQMGGTTLTIWLEFDGYDQSFQIDYETYWNNVIHSFQKIADYNRDIKISIEFKPWEPRTFSIIPNTGTALYAIDCIGRKNVGMTLDYCHSLMAGENPAMSLVLASMKGRLFGVHANDGHGFADDGHVFGSVSVVRSLEFMLYLKKQKYNGLIYFDTFPQYLDPVSETQLNIKSFRAYQQKIESIGMDKIIRALQTNKMINGQNFALDNIVNSF